VALRALALADARLELTLVGIGVMAIRALCEGQGLIEIASCVALGAADFHVHSEQWVFCLRVIELHRSVHFFPAGRRMAGFAGSFECALVWVRVAIDAGIEFDSCKLHRLVGAGGEMALLAGHLGVHSGQRIFCFGMVELLCVLPVGDVVTALAVGAKLAFVDVLMAGRAFLRKPLK